MSKMSENANRTTLMPPAVACSGKVPFDSFSLANGVANRNTDDRHHRSAYKCGHCGLWHIGTEVTQATKRKATAFSKQKLRFSL